MEKILIVEDDEGISDFVNLELEHEGFKTFVAADGRKALELFESEKPDLVLLDVMLPELSGLEVLRRIRKTSRVPVIMVTARGETYDKVNGLDAGADDYLPKPFEIEELLARMRSVLRRSSSVNAEAKIYKIRGLEMNTESMKVTLKIGIAGIGKENALSENGTDGTDLACGTDGTKSSEIKSAERTLDFSKTEYLMLKFLMENKNKVLSRAQIIDEIWGKNHFIDVNTVDVYIGYLRQKIDQATGETYIKTVRGSGYMMIDGE